jgi:LPXTG-site transpeptidase (sortase) family protein
MALMDKKQNQGRRAQRRVQKQRRRTGLVVFLGLVVLTLGALILFGTDQTSETSGEIIGRVSDPTVDGAPEIVDELATENESDTEDESTDEELASSEEDDENDPFITPPSDPTMFLSVPKLGINGAVVLDGEVGLEAGAQHLEGTGYPWIPGSNTYIAGHRIGFPGTGSDRIFYSLPSMSAGDEIILSDSLGQEYTYRVSNIFAVTPFDTWVAGPTGDDMVTLQVCTETPDDWTTIGPRLMSSGPESGRLIVQAEKVA